MGVGGCNTNNFLYIAGTVWHLLSSSWSDTMHQCVYDVTRTVLPGQSYKPIRCFSRCAHSAVSFTTLSCWVSSAALLFCHSWWLHVFKIQTFLLPTAAAALGFGYKSPPILPQYHHVSLPDSGKAFFVALHFFLLNVMFPPHTFPCSYFGPKNTRYTFDTYSRHFHWVETRRMQGS